MPIEALYVSASFGNLYDPEVKSISAPAGTYYPGQVVPVTVTFDSPVSASTAKVKFNGGDVEYAAAEDKGDSNVLTFPYVVQESDNTGLAISSVTATDLYGRSIEDYNPGGDTQAGKTLDGVVLSTPVKSHAFSSVSASISNATTEPSLDVSVAVSSDEKLTTWLAGSLEAASDSSGFVTKTVGTSDSPAIYVSIDGSATKYPLSFSTESVTGQTGTASIPLERNTGEDAIDYVVELYLDDVPVVGMAAAAELGAPVLVEEGDLSAMLAITNSDGRAYKFENESDPVIYVQGDETPSIKASIALTSGKEFSYASTSSAAGDNSTEDEKAAADFVWSSSDTTVATVSADGTVTPTGKTGVATISVTARNGGIEGKEVKASATYVVGDTTKTELSFAAGLTPFLTIPSGELSASDGQDVTVYWTSNLCDKNGDTPTTFTVTLKRGDETIELPAGIATVIGTKESPAGSVTIPAEYLSYDYSASKSNEFTVTVSASYADKTYSGSAKITLAAKPATVSLTYPKSLYILDTTGSVSVPWTVENLSRRDSQKADESDIFKFQVTRGTTDLRTDVALGETVSSGSYSGTYSLPITDVTASSDDPTSYREVYTVTIQAKNGTDSTWSYDSFLLYVYDANALQIMVDGAQAGSSLTMSNEDNKVAGTDKTIAEMSQEEILALKRDIYLENVISVNYGSYAWTEVADQIEWKSTDESVATINYQEGTLYENISSYSYTSYRPTTDFKLSGITDGTSTVSATHKLTGMTDSVDVTVETLTNKLYLFQCYPQVTTKLSYEVYTDAAHTKTEEKTSYSDATGAAAIYAPYGLASDVWCQTQDEDGEITGTNGNLYVGTFYLADLVSGEQDSTTSTLYPCNNLELRRAAYAYVYLKNSDGTPYKGSVTFRGGVYVNGDYKQGARFQLNDSGSVNLKGDEDQTVSLGSDGKLTVTMDQQQWGLANNAVAADDDIEYVFQVEPADSSYYPLFIDIDATANENAYVGSGQAAMTFRDNPETGQQHPFIVYQTSTLTNYGAAASLLDYTGNVGPSDSCPEGIIQTVVMWWGEDKTDNPTNALQLKTSDGVAVADESGEHEITNEAYEFSDYVLTYYTVTLNEQTVSSSKGGPLDEYKSCGLELEYYRDGSSLTRREDLPFQLCNMLGDGKIENQGEISSMLTTLGNSAGTDAKSSMSFGDKFVNVALSLAAGGTYTTGSDKAFEIQLVPTQDPTKFLGLIEVNVGNMQNNVTGVYADSVSRDEKLSYMPGIKEMMVLSTIKTPMQYAMDKMDDYNKVLKRKGVRDFDFGLSGYAESLIYYNVDNGKWEIQILDGGFDAGGGMNYTWNWNVKVGPVPLTASLTIAGDATVGMDALSVSYYEESSGVSSYTTSLGNDFLTELRIYLYLKFFSGVGFDYSIAALKLGIYGQIELDMQFAWLNRPYMDSDTKVVNAADGSSNRDEDGNAISYNLNGQHFKVDGQIGLEFYIKILFIKYEKVLFSYSFNLLNTSTGEYEEIQANWSKNKAAMADAITELLNGGNASIQSVSGASMLSLDLAPTVESRDYLEDEDFYRQWGDGGFSLLSLDSENALKSIEYGSYPYADPVVSDDGALVAYLSDMDSSDAEETRASFATKRGNSYAEGQAIDNSENSGYGDSSVELAGTGSFAIATWTRQMSSVGKDSGAVLTTDDQMVMMNSTETMAAIYDGSSWKTTQLSSNSSADLAPVVATNGKSGSDARAIVFWRSVASSAKDGDVTDFDERDCIVYRTYDGSKSDEEKWSETFTLYNGTSGSVKALTAAMLDDGTAAVAYTLEKSDNDTSSEEIAYAVVNKDSSEVTRNVQATNDAYLDENPQLAAVSFGSGDTASQRFVLGWYTEQGVSTDSASTLDGGSTSSDASFGSEATSDIRLIEFDGDGITGKLLPDSINKVADSYGVSITSNFRLTKNAESIEDLSIVWAERAEGTTSGIADGGNDSGSETATVDSSELTTEKDVLKGVKFYTKDSGTDGAKTIGFTGVIDIAEMDNSTLIDHFDAYVSDRDNNVVKAVLLSTAYGMDGKDGTTTKTVTLSDGKTLAQVTVPTQTSSMQSATASYADLIEVPAVVADYESIHTGATTQLQFTVENKGIHTVEGLTIRVGGTETKLEGVTIEPGETKQVTADYTVPASGIVDSDYTVTAYYSDEGATGTATTGGWTIGPITLVPGSNVAAGTVYLNLPDLEVTDASIVKEEEGFRTIQVKLNNTLDASVADDGRSVRIGFYSDATYENPITSIGTNGYVDVTDATDLKMIDEGGYCTQVSFNVEDYLKGDGTEEVEIPETGVTVYIKAEVIESKDGNESSLGEPYPSNNYGVVTCDNLQLRTGEEAILTTTLNNTDTASEAVVNIQNTSLTETRSGNLVATLLDEYGNVLEQQQSYDEGSSNNGLITLAGEQRQTKTFSFKRKGASVSVVYTNAVLESDDASLAKVSLDGVTLSYDETTNTYAGSGTDLSSALLSVVAANPKATITVNGKTYTQAMNVSLPAGETTFTIVTTAENGTNSTTTTVKVTNTVTSKPSNGASASYKVSAPAQTTGGGVSVSTSSARRGQLVTITASPDAGYGVSRVRVTTASGTKVQTTYDASNGTWTFTMPSGGVSVDVGFAELRDFDDVVSGAWYVESVNFVQAIGLMNGYAGTNDFGVGKSLTRAELATILWRYAEPGEAAATDTAKSVNETGLPDVLDGQFYTEAVNWAIQNNVFHGYELADGSREFGPDDPVTTEQLVTVLKNLTDPNGNASGDLTRFADGDEVSTWAVDQMAWGTGKELLVGYDTAVGRLLKAQEDVARERAATILMNAFRLGLLTW